MRAPSAGGGGSPAATRPIVWATGSSPAAPTEANDLRNCIALESYETPPPPLPPVVRLGRLDGFVTSVQPDGGSRLRSATRSCTYSLRRFYVKLGADRRRYTWQRDSSE